MAEARAIVDDGYYSIDNIVRENAIRPARGGRRHGLSGDAVVGAGASANLYSLLRTRIANGIDGYTNFWGLLVALPSTGNSYRQGYRRDVSVQSERGEDEAVARMRGLNTALASAAEKETAAEARLRALTGAAEAGREPTPSRDGAGLVAEDTRAGATMDEIVASVRRVSAVITVIADAARQQSRGIGEVNGAIAQIDQVTRQNAALVEQSAAAAESVREQSSRLARAVDGFRLGAIDRT